MHSIISLSTGNLDLSFLRKDFCENGQLLLGHFDMEGYFDEDELEEMGHDKMGRVLNAMAIAFKNEFDLDGVDEALAMLFDAVATAYKKFLVVKACEAKALLVSNAYPSTNPWLEKCCVSKVVDVLWHTHLMRPEHYLETCSALLGHVGVIDHDPGYVSPCVVARSTFFDKQQRLYSQQNRCLYGSSGVDYTMIGSMEYIVILRDTEEWLEMAFEDDLYHDVRRAKLMSPHRLGRILVPTARHHPHAMCSISPRPHTSPLYLRSLQDMECG